VCGCGVAYNAPFKWRRTIGLVNVLQIFASGGGAVNTLPSSMIIYFTKVTPHATILP
jgi:hypothetical protein